MNDSVSCTATVADADTGGKTFPAGSVSFANAGSATGSFSSSSCTLAQVGSTSTSSSSVNYTPSNYNGGTHTITAAYTASDGIHANSSDATGFALTVTKRTTTTNVSCSPSSTPINDSVSCTATVADADTGGKTFPAGSVSFANAGSATGSFSSSSCTLAQVGSTSTSSSSVNYTPSNYNGGTHTITAAYTASDGIHANSSDATGFALTVTKRTTTTNVSCSPSSTPINDSVSCTATVADADTGGKTFPAGSVSFANAGSATGSFSSSSCTLAQVGSTSTSSSSVNYTPSNYNGGTHTITAAYTASDGIHANSSDATGFALTVTKRTTTTNVSCSPSSTPINDSVSCTATVADADTGGKTFPAGSVSFANAGSATGSFSSSSCTLAQVGSTSTSSSSVNYTPSNYNGGTHTITAAYTASDGIHANSSDATGFALTVTKRTTTTNVSCSPSSTPINDSVSCTATVADADTGGKTFPAGSVSFANAGSATGSFSSSSCTLAQVGSTSTSSSSVNYTPSNYNGGTHTITAAYTASDGIHANSSDATGFALTVTKRTTTTNVSCSPSSTPINDSVSCTATVADADTGGKTFPAGSVSFANAGSATGSFSSSSCTLAQVGSTSTSSSSVNYTPSNYNGGTHTITAAYTASDGIHANSSDATGFALTVTKRTTTTNVSCSPSSTPINDSVSCTATVADADTGGKTFPAGSVSFANAGSATGSFSSSSCTLAQVGSTSTSSSSVNYTPSNYNGGTHTITAAYTASDGIHANSSDATGFALTVTKRTTTTNVSCSPSSTPINDSVSCTATVADADTGGKTFPAGSVSFANAGSATGSFSSSSCTLAQVGSTSTSSCSVNYTPSNYNGGTHTITAAYTASDGIHANSSDATGFALTVTKRTTTTNVSCSPSSTPINDSVSCTATVADADTGGKTFPAGSVSFANAGSATGSFSSSSCTLAQVGSTSTSSSSVNYTPSNYNGGTHTITAAYTASDGIHANSSDATGFALTVTKRTTTTNVSCSPSSTPINDSVSCTATVADADTGGKTFPAGSVSFANAGSATGSFSSSSCTLAQVGSTSTSSSSVNYTPSNYNGGTHTITAAYTASDGIHANSSDATGFALTVTKRTTTTNVSCSPSSTPINDSVSCTATVADADTGGKTFPAGSVSFANAGSATGSFSSSSCTLAQVGSTSTSSCSVNYTPSNYNGGTHTITAAYTASDGIHANSSDATGFALTVTKRTTTTNVSCSPSSTPINDSVSCTATVADADTGGKTFPAGSVSFANAGSATGSFSSSSCTLAQVGSTSTSSSSVNYTPSNYNGGTHTITAAYTASDGIHANSSDATGVALTVTKRSTSTSVTCSPSSTPINDSVSCTATVADADTGGKTFPAGSVSFANAGSATGSFSSSSCTLAQVGSTSTSS